MNQDLNKFLKELCKNQSSSIVGKLCKRIELIQKENNISSDKKLDILKSFCKELVYEEFRTLRNSVIFYNEGRNYTKLPIYKNPNPTKEK